MQRLEPAKCIAKAVQSCVVAWLLEFRAFPPQAVVNVRLRAWVFEFRAPSQHLPIKDPPLYKPIVPLK